MRPRVRLGIMCILFGLSVLSTGLLYPGKVLAPPEPTYHLNSTMARFVALDHEHLMADYIWSRAILRLGRSYRIPKYGHYRGFRDDLLLASDLDPKNFDIYLFGGALMSKVDDAVRLLKLGTERIPEDWHLPEFLGYMYYFDMNMPQMAAIYYDIASSRPGRPGYVKAFAERFAREGDDIRAGMELLVEMIRSNQDELLQNHLKLRLEQLTILAELRVTVKAYKQKVGSPPTRLEDLVKNGMLRAIPEDPLGLNRYRYDPEKDRVHMESLIPKPNEK